MNSCIVEQFLHHPLLVRSDASTGPDTQWRCHAIVPGISEYTVVPTPDTQQSDEFTPTEYMEFVSFSMHKVFRWMIIRRLQIYNSQCCLLDTKQKRVYPIDMVGEWGGRLALISIYYSRKGGGDGWARMSEYLRTVAQVCKTQYAIDADVVLINAFASYGVRGAKIT